VPYQQVERRRFVTGRGARRRDRRTHRIPVRFTYQELTHARQRAYAAGRPLARYIRETALGRTPRTLRLQAHDDVVHALSTIVRQLDVAAGEESAAAITRALGALRALLAGLAK
jgi:hypothetical protein